jgi:hypothetical protein
MKKLNNLFIKHMVYSGAPTAAIEEALDMKSGAQNG